jgi:ribA/ribD-fused uncharacterized protein
MRCLHFGEFGIFGKHCKNCPDRKPCRKRTKKKERKEIRFYGSKGEFGFLSNFYPCRIMFGLKAYDSVEHAYQSAKPIDQRVAEWIRNAPTARMAFIAGHNLPESEMQKDWWEENKVIVMRNLLMCCKFSQHPDLAEKLLATGDAILIEDSPTDSFWGIGQDGKGQNMLGKLLMEVRSKLK